MPKIIAQGAEAVLTRDGDKLIKDRVKKGYRLPELDRKIRKLRTNRERDLLNRARRAGVTVPNLLEVEESRITMEFIQGERIKDVLNDSPKTKRVLIYRLIGESLARLHSAGIMHGDLTTSNMILKNKTLYIIDIGLGKTQARVEDQAVDLYLLYEALKSTHFKYLNEAWQKILKAYCDNYPNAQSVLQRLKQIEKRRRYKG